MDPVIAAVMASVVIGSSTYEHKAFVKLGNEKYTWLKTFSAASQQVCNNPIAPFIVAVPYQICVTQAVLESGWGQHAPFYNHFGIKNGIPYAKYNSLGDGILGYCNAMSRNRLWNKSIANFSNQPAKFMIYVWACGYADNDEYVSKLINIMRLIYRLTSNEDFNIILAPDEVSLVNKLKKQKYGANRRGLANKLMSYNQPLVYK